MGNKDRYWALRSNGRCVACGEPAGGKSRCAYCAKKLSNACKESQRKKRQGLQNRLRELEAENAELKAGKTSDGGLEMVTEFERTVIDLRAMAPGLEPAGRYLLRMAADMMENQQRQIEAQRLIIKQQAIQSMSLSEAMDASRAERDAVTQHMSQLEQEITALRSENERLNRENFWLTNKEGKDDG